MWTDVSCSVTRQPARRPVAGNTGGGGTSSAVAARRTNTRESADKIAGLVVRSSGIFCFP